MLYQVDLDELSSVISAMEGFESTLSRQIGELATVVATLQKSWTGPAATSQRTAHDKIETGAKEVHKALVEMRQAARHAHDNYQTAATTNANMWGQVG